MPEHRSPWWARRGRGRRAGAHRPEVVTARAGAELETGTADYPPGWPQHGQYATSTAHAEAFEYEEPWDAEPAELAAPPVPAGVAGEPVGDPERVSLADHLAEPEVDRSAGIWRA